MRRRWNQCNHSKRKGGRSKTGEFERADQTLLKGMSRKHSGCIACDLSTVCQTVVLPSSLCLWCRIPTTDVRQNVSGVKNGMYRGGSCRQVVRMWMQWPVLRADSHLPCSMRYSMVYMCPVRQKCSFLEIYGTASAGSSGSTCSDQPVNFPKNKYSTANCHTTWCWHSAQHPSPLSPQQMHLLR